MNIESEFDNFFEFPTIDKSHVSSVSAKLFAKKCYEQGLSEKISELTAQTVLLPFAILPDELAALRRFHECVNDGQGYDVPHGMMRRLAEIGLVHRKSRSIYEHTVFGLSVLNGEFEHHYAAKNHLLPADFEKSGDSFVDVPETALPCGIVVPTFRVGQYLSDFEKSGDSFVDVPETALPCGIIVPAFRVGQYLSSRGSDGKVVINADSVPWVEIDYYDAKRACADSGLSLITETQWLAIAHDIAQQDINWTGGKVGVGKLYQGLHKGSVSSAQPGTYESEDPNERRWHQLSNGQRIFDISGNAFSWVFDDIQGNAHGLTTIIKDDSPSLTTAPYPGMEKGMGWRPDGERDWSGYALIRGGSWYSDGNAGVFNLGDVWPDVGSGSVGFRCTTKSGDRI